jgi:hypothetical protein
VLVQAPAPPLWAASHAGLPLPVATDGAGLELYYSARDGDGRSHIGRARMSGGGGALVVADHDPEPVLAPGALGTFDDCGVTTSCLVLDGSRWLLFYTGWSLGVTVPFYLSVGLAVSEDGGRTFQRASQAPLLDRSSADPYLTASPFVLRDGALWRMWYVSAVGWELQAGQPRHRYHLRYAESEDAMRWRRSGEVAVDFADPGEYAFGRPCVTKEGERYRMWFCARGSAYRLAYAESQDGRRWVRDDDAVGLDPSRNGWDSEMIAYPYVFDHDGARHMLYNGNGYGRTGIGYATALPAA